MNFSFEATRTDASGARCGRWMTPHGAIETPAFMPVGTQATVKGLTQEALEKLGAGNILANTYHLYFRAGHELVRRLGGAHPFIFWAPAIRTESGGFHGFHPFTIGEKTLEWVRLCSH